MSYIPVYSYMLFSEHDIVDLGGELANVRIQQQTCTDWVLRVVFVSFWQGVGGQVDPKRYGGGRGCRGDQGLGQVQREHAVAAGRSVGGLLLLPQQRRLLKGRPPPFDRWSHRKEAVEIRRHSVGDIR